jgi:hypothetical protein
MSAVDHFGHVAVLLLLAYALARVYLDLDDF